MKNIQILIFIVFGIFVIVGVLVFAGVIPSPMAEKEAQTNGDLLIWGVLPEREMSHVLRQNPFSGYSKIRTTYKEHSEASFASDLAEAISSDEGPDIILFPEDLMIRLASKIERFTPEMYSERTFRDTFIEEGELFITPTGILALPVSVDPLVMYWNRSMFSNDNIPKPPKYWDEFLTLSPILTKRTDANDILKSAISFGEFRNVTHAKDILALLMIQAGNPVVLIEGDTSSPVVAGASSLNIPPGDEAVRFYTDFSDPQKPVYSWNRSFPDSKSAFLAQDLALYFGYASELSDIQSKNPNLNFDIAPVPQVRDYPFKKTFGRITGVAVTKASQQKPAAFFLAGLFTFPEADEAFRENFHTAPVSRAFLAERQSDPYRQVVYDAALTAAGWRDPDPVKSERLFQSAIESVTSGSDRIENAVGRLQSELLLLFK
ncbi:MAG: extracellular solute-binding protein [Parcubacteria group bacterium]|nr:extracellular solute-binding protein [Parcubacteria group bacterium]